MSTSIYKIDNFKMGYKSIVKRNRSPTEKVKRALFGAVDHEANFNYLKEQLNIEYSKTCHKWNFNFRDEIPLDDGDYIWMTSSSANRKRKLVELPDNSACGFQPIEGGGGGPSHSLEPVRPIAGKPKTWLPKQSLITDFMPKSKRPVVCSKETTDERPNKIPKLGSYCSS